jgi:hypothetical protein
MALRRRQATRDELVELVAEWAYEAWKEGWDEQTRQASQQITWVDAITGLPVPPPKQDLQLTSWAALPGPQWRVIAASILDTIEAKGGHVSLKITVTEELTGDAVPD